MMINKAAIALLTGASIVSFATPASADTVALSYQELGPSGPATGSGAVTAFSGSQSAFYGDTFTGPTTPLTAAPSWGFYDDFIFSVPTSVAADSVTSTINLGNLSIDDLEVRLYNESGNSPPVLGTPNGTTISAWSAPINGGPGITGSFSVLDADLAAGTYVLEVRGNVTGSAGGSYSGTLNVAPVPLPAAFPLLLSGLGFLGVLARRRSAA